MITFDKWRARQPKDQTKPIDPRMAWNAAMRLLNDEWINAPAAAKTQIEDLQLRIRGLEAERDELKETAFRQDATITRMVHEKIAERAALERERLVSGKLEAALKTYLLDNNPDGFGCACEPNHICGPCSASIRQAVLRAALAEVGRLRNANPAIRKGKDNG